MIAPAATLVELLPRSRTAAAPHVQAQLTAAGVTSIVDVAEHLEQQPASAAIRWAWATFGNSVCVTTSATDAVVVDLAVTVAPEIEVVFIDTGYHFDATLETFNRMRRRYGLNAKIITAVERDDALWKRDTQLCCSVNKTAQLERALAHKSAWVTGLRRDESETRAHTPTVELDRRGLVKVNPLASWTRHDIETYIEEHDIITHPLLDDGYPSIGCAPCTNRSTGSERSGRWEGEDRTECGLHL